MLNSSCFVALRFGIARAACFGVMAVLVSSSSMLAATIVQDTESEAQTDASPVEELYEGVSFGDEVEYKWKVGVKIATAGGSFKEILLTIPIPSDWPEQTVTVDNENIPIEFGRIKVRELEGNFKQIVAKIDRIPSRKLVEFDMTYQVKVRTIDPPPDTTIFEKPTKLTKELRGFLGVGPGITYRNGKIRSTVKEVVSDLTGAWEQTEAIFDWVRENIEHRAGESQDSISTFRNQFGNAEDLVGLFVAMCRANKVPARMVWIEGHQYAEFYLVDPAGNGHWIPCNVAGIREFGSYSNPRIIQQKGDNIRVPESKQRLKFVPEFVTGNGKAQPRVLFVRELLSAD